MTRTDITSVLTCKEVRYNARLSFSQDGEDMLMANLVDMTRQGFYIDIGALHPIRYSNTMFFYMSGWKGINIDATPGSMDLFKKYRKRDINIEAGISNTGETMTYFIFEEPALNTFSDDVVREREKQGIHPIREVDVPTYHVMELLDKFIKENQKIDILDIDIEGFDKHVITEWDFSIFRPRIIMFERSNNRDMSVVDLLSEQGYKIVASSFRNDIYVSDV